MSEIKKELQDFPLMPVHGLEAVKVAKRAMVMENSGIPLKAVILVGGQGIRLQPLTRYMPKSMAPIVNRPFLEHIIAYLERWGVREVILALHYLPQVVQHYFGDGRTAGVKLTYAIEDSPLGTAGAVKNAERYLDSTFLVLNGDTFAELDMTEMLAFHRRKGAKATIALSWADNPSAFGVVETNSDGRVTGFTEKPSLSSVTTNWVNAGIYILEPEILKLVPAASHYMFEKELFPHLLKQNEPVYGYPFNGYWLDMGTLESYLCLNCDLLLSKVSSPLTQGLSGDGVSCERDVIIHPSAKVTGPVVIGARCEIRRGAYIKGPVVIGDDCYVGEGARLEQCVVGSGARIGDNEQVINCVLIPDHIMVGATPSLRRERQ